MSVLSGVFACGRGSYDPDEEAQPTYGAHTCVRVCVGMCLGMSLSTHGARWAHLAHLHVLSRLLSREGRKSGAQKAAAVDEVLEPIRPHTVCTVPATIKRAATTQELTEAAVENVGCPSRSWLKIFNAFAPEPTKGMKSPARSAHLTS